MKRLSVLLFSLCLLLCQGLYAEARSYSSRDGLYKRVERICILSGVLPPTVSPASTSYLLGFVDRIDETKLSREERELLSSVKEELCKEPLFSSGVFASEFELEFNLNYTAGELDFYDYSNKESSLPSKDIRNEGFVFRYEDPFAYMRANLFFGPYVALEGSLQIGNNNHHIYRTSLGWLTCEYEGKRYSLFTTTEGDVNNVPLDFPYLAGLSISNDYASFFLGRYPHKMGLGMTGNMIIGDNFSYQEVLMAALHSDFASYYASVTRFDQMIEADNGYYQMSRSKFRGDQQYRVVHRLEISPLENLRASVDLGTLYNTTVGLDIRFLQPLMLQHNYGNYVNKSEKEYYDEANNIMGVSLDYLPTEGVLLSLELTLDQWQTAAEDQTSVPPAFGAKALLMGVKCLDDALLDIYLEAVYTNPYLYLNGKYDENGRDHNLDHIVGYHTEHVDDYGYSGYVFGPDTIAFATGISYEEIKTGWGLDFSMLYKIQGQKTLKHRASEYHMTEIDMSDSYFVRSEDGYEATPTGGFDSTERLLSLKGGISYEKNWFGAYLDVVLNHYENYGNDPDKDNLLAPMVQVGVKCSFF